MTSCEKAALLVKVPNVLALALNVKFIGDFDASFSSAAVSEEKHVESIVLFIDSLVLKLSSPNECCVHKMGKCPIEFIFIYIFILVSGKLWAL